MTVEQRDLVVLGGGPGGYSAAFRAADLGRSVTIVDPRDTLGGVCLNEGCIPSKALLHAAGLMREIADLSDWGVACGRPRVDLERLRAKTASIVGQLTGGLAQIARRRKVEVIADRGRFAGGGTIAAGSRTLQFKNAIVAVGSSPVVLPGWPESDRIWDSTAALELRFIPERLAIIGGGIIGLEMATIYSALGSAVTIIELADQIMPGADLEATALLSASLVRQGVEVKTGTRVERVTARAESITLTCAGSHAGDITADAAIQAVGRRANGSSIDAQRAGIHVDERGCIPVGDDMRTNRPEIFAIGDVTGGPMLAHRASHHGKVAAEAASGLPSRMVTALIPSVAYTIPEVAWVGATTAPGTAVKISKFPWNASGRNVASEASSGLTKLAYDGGTGRLLGGTIVGAHAGELIAEISLAIEMGATIADLALTVHPHPTLSETSAFAAERAMGVLTEL